MKKIFLFLLLSVSTASLFAQQLTPQQQIDRILQSRYIQNRASRQIGAKFYVDTAYVGTLYGSSAVNGGLTLYANSNYGNTSTGAISIAPPNTSTTGGQVGIGIKPTLTTAATPQIIFGNNKVSTGLFVDFYNQQATNLTNALLFTETQTTSNGSALGELFWNGSTVGTDPSAIGMYSLNKIILNSATALSFRIGGGFTGTEVGRFSNNGHLMLQAGGTYTDNGSRIQTTSISYALTPKTAAYTLGSDDYTVLCDGTSGAFTVTLPTASGINGRIYIIKKTDASANAITIATTSSQTIDGATTYSLSAQYKYVVVQANTAGPSWSIIGNN